MKIALLLFIAFACAAHARIRPHWEKCDSIGNFQLYSITLNDTPIVGQDSIFRICGFVEERFSVSIDEIHITAYDGSKTVLDKRLKEDVSIYNEDYCFDITLKIPQNKYSETMWFKFEFGKLAACADVAITL